MVKIAELGETSVEFLLKGREVRDLEGNLMPVNLRLHDHTFIKHHRNTPKSLSGIILYTIMELTDDKTFYYSGFRSIIELGQLDLQKRLLPATIYIDNISKGKFSNIVVELESITNFKSEDYQISKRSENFRSLSLYLFQKNMSNNNTYYNFSKDLSNILQKVINDVIDLPNGIAYDFHFIYLDDQTTKFNTENIQTNNN